MSERKEGLKAAMEAAEAAGAMDPARARPAPAAQLPLLPAEVEPEEDAEGDMSDVLTTGAGPLDQALAEFGAGRGTPRRSAGRPKGARNRSTEEWRKLLLSTHRSPLLVLADIYSMPVEELAARLHCDRIEAIKIQMAAARDVAPYLHQRLPQAVEITGDALPMMVLQMPSAAAAPGDGAVQVVDLTSEQYQQLSGDARRELNASELNATDQPIDIAGENARDTTD